MKRQKLFGLLTVGLLAAGLTAAAQDRKSEGKKGETFEGIIKKVDPSAHMLIVVPGSEAKKGEAVREREFLLKEATKFIFHTAGGKKEQTREEAYKNEELKEAARVTILTDPEEGWAREVRVGVPPKGAKE